MRTKGLVVFFIVWVLLFFFSCTKNEDIPLEKEVTHTIIDTDVDIDDAMALLYLLKHPGIKIDAISVCGTGMSDLNPATDNILGLIKLAGKQDIPIVCGDTAAIESVNTFMRPHEWIVQSNTMMGLELPVNLNQAQNITAVEFLIEFLGKTKKAVRIVSLGPLTNLGMVLQQNPGLAAKIESVYIMGGAVYVPGNLQSGGVENNPFAEWNIFLDPDAADIVFQSGVKVVLVPLDATNHAPVTSEFYNRFSDYHTTPEANFVFEIISKLIELYDNFYFWDPLAAVIATNPNIAEIENYSVKIVTDTGNENGWTKVDSVNGNPIGVCQDIDLDSFENLFLDILNEK